MNVQIGDIQKDVACDPQTALLVQSHYETLKSVARAKRRRANAGQTLLTTDLLHESWIKIRNQGNWTDEQHFLRTAALAMRHVLIDYARSKLSAKHGAKAVHYDYDDMADSLPEFKETPEQIVAIGDLMRKLKEVNARYVDIVDLRYFGGFTEKETASLLGITDRTVRRDWTLAKAWLAKELA